jgi:hypothetical protein
MMIAGLGRALLITSPILWLNSLTAFAHMLYNNRQAGLGKKGYQMKSLGDFMNGKDRLFHALLPLSVMLFLFGLLLFVFGY